MRCTDSGRAPNAIPAWAIGMALAVTGALGALLLLPRTLDPSPPRFAKVEPGLYRGGYPQADELRWLAASLQVRSVVSLMRDSPQEGRSDAEQRTATGLGLRLREFPMPGNGQAAFDVLDTAADAIAEEMQFGPVYFHCSAGRQRSNAATAAWRMKRCGWTADQAIAELRERFELDPDSPLERHLRAYYRGHIATQPAQNATDGAEARR